MLKPFILVIYIRFSPSNIKPRYPGVGLSVCPNLNCSLSMRRMDDGCSLYKNKPIQFFFFKLIKWTNTNIKYLVENFYFTCLAISRKHLTPDSKSGKTIDPYFLQGGSGRILIVASVMTPRVPATETFKCERSTLS